MLHWKNTLLIALFIGIVWTFYALYIKLNAHFGDMR